MNKIPQRTK